MKQTRIKDGRQGEEKRKNDTNRRIQGKKRDKQHTRNKTKREVT